jgi:hypothetical protein
MKLAKTILVATMMVGVAGLVATAKHPETLASHAAMSQCCDFPPPPPPGCPPDCSPSAKH